MLLQMLFCITVENVRLLLRHIDFFFNARNLYLKRSIKNRQIKLIQF